MSIEAVNMEQQVSPSLTKMQKRERAKTSLRRAISKPYAEISAEIKKVFPEFGVVFKYPNDVDIEALKIVWFAYMKSLSLKERDSILPESPRDRLNRLCGFKKMYRLEDHIKGYIPPEKKAKKESSQLNISRGLRRNLKAHSQQESSPTSGATIYRSKNG